KGVGATVDHHQVIATAASEGVRYQADRLLQGSDGRCCATRVQGIQARASAEAIAGDERVTRVVEEDADVAAGLVADHNVGQAIAVDVHQGNVRRGLPRGQGDRGREGFVWLLEGDLDPVVEGVGHNNVIEAIAGEVGGGDARWQQGGGEGCGAAEPAVGTVSVQGDGVHESVLGGQDVEVGDGVGRGDSPTVRGVQHRQVSRGEFSLQLTRGRVDVEAGQHLQISRGAYLLGFRLVVDNGFVEDARRREQL